MSIHLAANIGFGAGADPYERGRPEYPQEAVERLVRELRITNNSVVVDLGAGREVNRRGTGRRNEAEARERLPECRDACGRRGSDGSADRLCRRDVAAQAFHWFDSEKAIAEINRVLKPGGKLGLIWNVRDESHDWVAKLTAIIDRHEGDAPRFRSGAWRIAFDRTTLFSRLVSTEFRHDHRGPREMVVDRVMSISFVAALPATDKDRIPPLSRKPAR